MQRIHLKDKVWIEYEEDGKTVINPYKLLPKEYEDSDGLTEWGS